jgi:hypothetical protein
MLFDSYSFVTPRNIQFLFPGSYLVADKQEQRKRRSRTTDKHPNEKT